jgi:hypothetical protein
MSYSFNVKGANKAEAKAAVDAKFEAIVAGQEIHSRDRAAVLANANAVIDLLADDDTKDISVSVNGHVSWTGAADEEPTLSGVSISSSASHAPRQATPA